jgi:alanine racemase
MRTRAIIHLDRFVNNFNAVRNRVGQNRHICLPVKADAYGHGALEIARAGIKAGAFCLGVSSVQEGLELRNSGIKCPVLLFSQPHPQEIPEIFSGSLTPFVSDIEFVKNLNSYASRFTGCQKLPVHLKIDTGMNRIGCPAKAARDLALYIDKCPGLTLAGTATHFACSDSTDPSDILFTNNQTSRFIEAVDAIRAAGLDAGIVHAANSAAVIFHPNTWFDMVRPGILLYGYKTIDEKNSVSFPFEPLNVQPVMELRSMAVLIRKVNKDESVSYGRTWTAPQDTYIAVLPVGYADGLPRLASGKWQAVIGGRTYPLVGRICMDHCMIDLGLHSNVSLWDEAIIFGSLSDTGSEENASSYSDVTRVKNSSKNNTHDASALANITGTIPYEITCGITKRVPRVFVKGEG